MTALPIAAEKLDRATSALVARSIRAYSNPYTLFTWPEKPPSDTLAMSESVLSLYGHALFAELSDEQRWRLALLETVNFFSVNIAGERELMAGLAQRLYCGGRHGLSRYLQLFLHEENAHTAVFARFCLDYGGSIYPDRQLRFPRSFLPGEEEFLFFARVLIFEEIAHHYNRRLSADDAVWPIARDIHRYHAEDETRHIAFGRMVVADLWERSRAQWSADDQRSIGRYLHRYIETVCRSYVNPAVYETFTPAGSTARLRDEVLSSPHWKGLTAAMTHRCRSWLRHLGVFGER